MNVSTLIITRNEELTLPACLAALAWCDDIVILDSGSTDRTIEIALACGARVLDRPFDSFAAQRNHGLDHGSLRHDWVLHLDADEIVTQAFVDALGQLEPPPGIDGYLVPSKTMLFGQWLRYAGMYPTYQVRLGHRQRLRFVQVGHGQRENAMPDRIAVFDHPYLHDGFANGMNAWLHKHVRYAEAEAGFISEKQSSGETAAGGGTQRRRALKRYAAYLPLWSRPLARFAYVYVWRQGFRDGRAGLMYALMLAVYEG
jgi:glycosyltransferase involved in cell wall biosynthesis